MREGRSVTNVNGRLISIRTLHREAQRPLVYILVTKLCPFHVQPITSREEKCVQIIQTGTVSSLILWFSYKIEIYIKTVVVHPTQPRPSPPWATHHNRTHLWPRPTHNSNSDNSPCCPILTPSVA